MPKIIDLQRICIKRMGQLGLTPDEVATRVAEIDAAVSRNHVCDYLTRRKRMGDWKLCRVLQALDLEVMPRTGRSDAMGDTLERPKSSKGQKVLSD